METYEKNGRLTGVINGVEISLPPPPPPLIPDEIYGPESMYEEELALDREREEQKKRLGK